MSKWIGRVGAILVFFLIINISVNGVIKYEPKTDQQYAQTTVAKMTNGYAQIKKDVIDGILEITGYNKAAGAYTPKKEKKDTTSDIINKIFKIIVV